MVAVSEPFYGVSIIVEGLMMGVGKTRVPFLYNITGMWLVRILGTMICTRFLGNGSCLRLGVYDCPQYAAVLPLSGHVCQRKLEPIEYRHS